jgi:two-component sensor histidine kinase
MMPSGGELAAVGCSIDNFMDELDISRAEQEKAERNRNLLMRELEHRVKNVLANVQAIANQTFKNAPIPQAFLDSFTGRIHAISNAHNLLLAQNWQSADLREVLATAVTPFDRDPTPFSLVGPDIVINARAALAISMTTHELCTNAEKYGALRDSGGRVIIEWVLAGPTETEFNLRWTELDGPPVIPPTSSGFGSTMIKRVLSSELNGSVSVSYTATGVICDLAAPIENLVANT